ncbi:MAG TPA: hypothetical protein VGF39_11710 [Stellaceae bacterium]
MADTSGRVKTLYRLLFRVFGCFWTAADDNERWCGGHRIRHYGLLASPGCKANIARARELIAAPTPEVAPPAANGTADPDAASDHSPLCPCCGGHMMIVEVFGRGGAPARSALRRRQRDLSRWQSQSSGCTVYSPEFLIPGAVPGLF